MNYDFDRVIDRRNSDSSKWNYYAGDVLPLWTADMDFRVPQPVIDVLRARVEHGIYGYSREPPELREVIVARLARLYGWRVSPESIVFQPGVVLGFNRACQISGSPGDGVLVQPPVYPPILAAPALHGMIRQESELARTAEGRYEIDLAAFDHAATERTRLFILCNPHNPVGRVFGRKELEGLAEVCLRRGAIICSDEIHCDLVFEGLQHVPIASLGSEVARRSITLMAPSKTYNIAGLHCSFAVIPDRELRGKILGGETAYFPEVNALGMAAALAAYRDGQEWLDQILQYLEANRELVVQFIRREMPGIEAVCPEATYLAWIDCRKSAISAGPYRHFLDKAKVALSDGARFGRGGEGFVRLNFGCPRSTLLEALERMKSSLVS
ncbi:MAG TPA: PatB family C-S lyase [Acidobacteriota bacterium]|nr:PatB family C-S lyase [Acidobacteriota bacterium]